MLSQHHHHHNHHHNKTIITTFIFQPYSNRRYRYIYWKKILDAFDISCVAHWDEKGHRLFAPGAIPPRVNTTAQSELSPLYHNLNCNSCLPFTVTCDVASLSPPCAPLLPPRTGSPQSQQWPQHRLPRRAVRKPPLHLCTAHCTTTTNHTPPAAQSVALRRETLTPQLTLTALLRRTFNAQPPRQPPAREHALPTHTYHPHLHHQLHHSDTLFCIRRLGRRQPAVHWPTRSVTRTTLHTATCPRHSLCYQHQARPPKSATLHQ